MTEPLHNQPVNSELRPLVYKALYGLIVWLVLSIWVLFSGAHYIGLILTVITVFFIIVTGIPTLIWLTWRRRAAHPDHRPEETFRLWATQQFRAWTGDLPGGAAAAQILLPIAAVSFGMTIFGLIYDLSIPHLL
jgi:amino acid transporter